MTVVGTSTGRRVQRSKPAGCGFEGYLTGRVAAAGRTLLPCAGGVTVVNGLRRDGLRVLPTQSGKADIDWTDIGARWVAGSASCGSTSCTTLVSLTTGRLQVRRGLHALDLDAKSPTKVATCSALDIADELEGLSGVGPRRALTSSSRDVLLTSCRRRTVLARESARVQGVQLRGGIASWDTGIAGADFLAGDPVPRSVVLARHLDSGRTTRRPATRASSSGCGETSVPGSFGISSHTRHDLFREQTSRIDIDRICTIGRVRVLVTALRR